MMWALEIAAGQVAVSGGYRGNRGVGLLFLTRADVFLIDTNLFDTAL